MNVIINNINIYFINGHNNTIKVEADRSTVPDVNDICSHLVINDDLVVEYSALIERLKERVAEGQREIKEFLERYNNKNK